MTAYLSSDQVASLLFPRKTGSDVHVWGNVKSVNEDKSYQVQLNASSVTTKCSPGCTAGVGDRVLVCCMADGRCVAVCRLGGDRTDPCLKTSDILDTLYPVGTILFRYDHVSPASVYGGEWERIVHIPYGVPGEDYEIGKAGGSETASPTVAQMARHTHWNGWSGSTGGSSFNGFVLADKGADGASVGYEGGGEPFSILPPHVNVSIWRRRA